MRNHDGRRVRRARTAFRVAWYRFTAGNGHRLGPTIALAGLIAVIGAVGMGATAAARRTQSSYPAMLRASHPSDLTVSSYGTSGDSPSNAYSPALTAQISKLPGVRHVESWVGLGGAPLAKDGTPDFTLGNQVNMAGSVDGLYFDEDRPVPVEGRMANPSRTDEFVTSEAGAKAMRLRVGEVVPMGFYGPAQASMPGFGTASVAPQLRVDMHLVGIVVFNDRVVQDDVDRLPTNAVFTPALTRVLLASGSSQGTWYGIQLVKPNRDVAATEQSIAGLLPPGSAYFFRVAAPGTAKVERAIKPEAIAIGVFGAIAALATVIIAGQTIVRQLRDRDEDVKVMRALGAASATTVLDGVVRIVIAVVAGSLAAAAIAVALSPLAPLGPVRRVAPTTGVVIDWTVIGAGVVLLVLALTATAVIAGWWSAPHRVARRSQIGGRRTSRAVAAATSSGLPASAVVGIRFATGDGRDTVPVRSALTAAVGAVVLVVATLSFGASLRTLVSRPSLYGWNWDYALTSINDVPPQARQQLDHDPLVAGWTGVTDLNVQIDGVNVPALVGDSHPAVTPAVLSGHVLNGDDQIVLGAATLRRLHAHVGGTVRVSFGSPQQAPLYVPPTTLHVVGTATMPAVLGGGTFADHTTMDTGALLPMNVAPPAFLQAVANPDPTLNGPTIVFVRLRTGVSRRAGAADMRAIAAVGNAAFAADPSGVGDTVNVLGVQHPAEIVNYRSTGATPIVLALAFSVGAAAALGLTLAALVRKRRRDLAVLRTLGFTRRQLAATVAWQSSIAALVGVAVGVPAGVALGRQLWILFARSIHVVPHSTVPTVLIAVVAGGALLVANAAAAIPGRIAARTSAATSLRQE